MACVHSDFGGSNCGVHGWCLQDKLVDVASLVFCRSSWVGLWHVTMNIVEPIFIQNGEYEVGTLMAFILQMIFIYYLFESTQKRKIHAMQILVWCVIKCRVKFGEAGSDGSVLSSTLQVGSDKTTVFMPGQKAHQKSSQFRFSHDQCITICIHLDFICC